MMNVKNSVYLKVSLYAEYTDAQKKIWHKSQEDIESKIREYLTTLILIQGFLQTNRSQPDLSQSSKFAQANQPFQKLIEEIIVADAALPPNAAAQKKATETINATNMKLAELQ